ncbi:MAG: Tm-1-like ATP-binding domain-containing protein [Desulfomonilaceae bacterium]
MNPVVAIVGALDTKGEEVEFIKDELSRLACNTVVIDVGTLHPPMCSCDVSREDVAIAAGVTMEEIHLKGDRRFAVESVILGASRIAASLLKDGRLSGILSVGGGTGTHIGMGIMRSLPLGVPKLMVSTVASRDMSRLIGTKDIAVMHSVVDILGLNPISRKILSNAAAAIAGMAKDSRKIQSQKMIVGLTSFGFITEGAMKVKSKLESSGYEVAPFHANGTGGMAMEDLIEQGVINAVVDLALHEFPDSLHGGYCGDIGPGRLETAGRLGLPQVVVPGGLDCIVLEFNSRETMPVHLRDRPVFWYDFRSGVRTSIDDMVRLARIISEKLNRSLGPTKVVIPIRGFSEADSVGAPLWDPVANQTFISELASGLNPGIGIIEVDAHINDAAFADAVVNALDQMVHK